MKARRHEMHTLETPEASEGRGGKEPVEFEPAREQARHNTREVQEHLVRHQRTFGTRHIRQKACKAREHVRHEAREARGHVRHEARRARRARVHVGHEAREA